MVGQNHPVGNIKCVKPKAVGKKAPIVQVRPATGAQQQPEATSVASLKNPTRSHRVKNRAQVRSDAATGSIAAPSSPDTGNILVRDSSAACACSDKESVGDTASSHESEVSEIVNQATSAGGESLDRPRIPSIRAVSSTNAPSDKERAASKIQTGAVAGPSCFKKSAVKTNVVKEMPAKIAKPKSPAGVRNIAPAGTLLNQRVVSRKNINKKRPITPPSTNANADSIGARANDALPREFCHSSKILTGEFSVHCQDLTNTPIYNVGSQCHDITLVSAVCEGLNKRGQKTWYDANTSEYYVRSSVSPCLSEVDPERARVSCSTRAINSVNPRTWRVKPQVEFCSPIHRDSLPLDPTEKYIRGGKVNAWKVAFDLEGYHQVDPAKVDCLASLIDSSRDKHYCVAIYVKIWLQVFRVCRAARENITFLAPPTVTDLNAYFKYVPFPLNQPDLVKLVQSQVVTYISPLDIRDQTDLSIMLMLATEGPGWDLPQDARICVADDFEWPVIPLGLLCTYQSNLPLVSPENSFQPVIASANQMIKFMSRTAAATGSPDDVVTGYYIASTWWCSAYKAAPAWSPYPGDGARVPSNATLPKWRDLPMHQVGYVPSAEDQAVLGSVVGAREGNPNPTEWADLGHLLEYTDHQNPGVRIPVPSIFVPVDNAGVGFCVKRVPAPRGFNPLHRLLQLTSENVESAGSQDLNDLTTLMSINPDLAATTIGTIFGSIGSTLFCALNLTGREVSALMCRAHDMPSALEELASLLGSPPRGIVWSTAGGLGSCAIRDAVCAVMKSRVPHEVSMCSDWLNQFGRFVCTPVNMYAAYNSYNHTPIRGPVMSIDNLLRRRPIEWGIPTPYADYNFDADLVDQGYTSSRGFRPWRGVQGELQRMAVGWHPYSLVAYNGLALNFMLQYASANIMAYQRPPALVNDVFHVSRSECGTHISPRQAVRRVQPVWNPLLYCYEPTTLNTYDWASDTITMASLEDSPYQRLACAKIKSGGESNVRVGFILVCSNTRISIPDAPAAMEQSAAARQSIQPQGKRGYRERRLDEDEQSLGTCSKRHRGAHMASTPSKTAVKAEQL